MVAIHSTASSPSDGIEAATPPRAYARFSRRIQATLIDNIILFVGFVAALFLAASTGIDGASQAIGFAALAAVLLYEPLLVSIKGGTIGHSIRNLRVIDDRTSGNIGLGAAFVRYFVKMLLGWASFVTMMTTKRHQTLHDMLTHSTVQMRDAHLANTDHFVAERAQLSADGMPSMARRSFAICSYMVLWFSIFVITIVGLVFCGAISRVCLHDSKCAVSETALLAAANILLLSVSARIFYLGWNGRLFGCRAKI